MHGYAVISDIHANLYALEAVLGRIHEMEIDRIICLGDVVGYGPHPDHCLDLVIRCCSTIVLGNHDEAVINPRREEEFNGPARQAIVWTRSVLGPLHMDAISRLRAVEYPQETVMCVHDSPVDAPTDYVHDPHIAALAFRGLLKPICLLGHTHVPMVFEAPGPDADHDVTPADVVAYLTPDGVPIPLDPRRRYRLGWSGVYWLRTPRGASLGGRIVVAGGCALATAGSPEGHRDGHCGDLPRRCTPVRLPRRSHAASISVGVA